MYYENSLILLRIILCSELDFIKVFEFTPLLYKTTPALTADPTRILLKLGWAVNSTVILFVLFLRIRRRLSSPEGRQPHPHLVFAKTNLCDKFNFDQML